MPVRICPDCCGKVSTTLDTCPHCGFHFSNSCIVGNENAEFRCFINIKRNNCKKGKAMAWFIYKDDQKIADIDNGGMFSFTATEPGQYSFIVYHPSNCPTTRPIEMSNCVPAKIDLNISSSDKEINVMLDINASIFKSSIVVSSIERK